MTGEVRLRTCHRGFGKERPARHVLARSNIGLAECSVKRCRRGHHGACMTSDKSSVNPDRKEVLDEDLALMTRRVRHACHGGYDGGMASRVCHKHPLLLGTKTSWHDI